MNNKAETRIRKALSYAGPSLTITTLTTCLAFACGMFSSLEALRSFCLYATVCVALIYVNNMTFFLSVVVWDTRRVEHRKTDCFGLCHCKENSYLFCCGKLASVKQQEYSVDQEMRESQEAIRLVDSTSL